MTSDASLSASPVSGTSLDPCLAQQPEHSPRHRLQPFSATVNSRTLTPATQTSRPSARTLFPQLH
ncbi:hypothetical protein BDV98DRAFT_562588 [Pterulicium gracile]|uniref:Uncharacterized protein n=1 Tax=Pterulicium gracile TaxID=1884261 RepID=A0A5C3QTE0_9AGAR|nr:hypothetical protein BDV98DRAFT_562588 [Pterula gracilis]